MHVDHDGAEQLGAGDVQVGAEAGTVTGTSTARVFMRPAEVDTGRIYGFGAAFDLERTYTRPIGD